MTIQKYRTILRQRRNDLKAELKVAAYDRKNVNREDTRHIEIAAIRTILRLLKDQ